MFNEALGSFVDADRLLLEGRLQEWCDGTCANSRQIALNIRLETALRPDAFADLLGDFCEALSKKPTDALAEWESVCRQHQFRGTVLPEPCPNRLGRAVPIAVYANLLAPSHRVPGKLTPAQAEETIRKVAMARGSPVDREARILRRGLLGRFVVWATFSETEPTESPFRDLPHRTEAIRTALGLGHISETETLVLLTWKREGPLGSLSLHRPTVADAGKFPWFRPVADPAAKCGYSCPLDPNPQGLSPCPEVVHQEITGETLVFPIILSF